MKIIVRNIIFPFLENEEEQVKAKFKALHIKAENYAVYKRSTDARNKNNIKLNLSVITDIPDGTMPSGINDVAEYDSERYDISSLPKSEKSKKYPVVCGFGPSGMFCALLLAKCGYEPIVIERGSPIDKRAAEVDNFLKNRILDPSSNIQFGEGGAGAFSDGKLITRINDKRCSYVLGTFIDFGAPKDISYLAHPHIGTDLLRDVVKNIREEIIRLGGKIIFNTSVIDVDEKNGGVDISLSDGEKLHAPAIFLATGHSSHDTYKMLISKGYDVVGKDFSVGVRIEHPQRDVERSMYGAAADKYMSMLPKAEYSVSLREGERGVYSFCMCPGGTVMASASDEGSIVTNGMSYHARDLENSNSAIAVSVLKKDYGNSPEKAIEFQRNIEINAFRVANDYRAPFQTVGDFLDRKRTSGLKGINPSYPHGVIGSDFDSVLPSFVCDMLRKGLNKFGGNYSFFKDKNAPLTGVETRTSSPVRIVRNALFLATDKKYIYPVGEGAGYAGGITSAAIDGLKAAEMYIKGKLL